MADREFPLSLIIRAVDRATEPLRAINRRMHAFTAPVRKLNNSFKALSDEAGLPRLVKGFWRVGTSLRGVVKETVALGAKVTAMAAGAAYALYRIVRGSVDAGDKLSEMADRVGLSIDAYAQLQFSAAQADVEQESFNAAMDQFNKRLGEAKAGGGSLLAFLQKVSPALAIQVKGAKTTEEALGLMTGAFERVEDPGKRAALSAAAFGRSGLQMGTWLHQGSKAIAEQRARYLALAGSQEKFARGASDLDNAMRETEMAFTGLSVAASAALFPALTEVAKALTDILVGQRGNLAAWAREAGAAISGWVQGGGLTDLVKSMREWAGIIKTVIAMLGGLKGILVIAGTYLASGFLLSVGAAVKAIWGLGAALLATPIGWFLVAVAALGAAAYLIYKNWEPIKLFFKFLWEDIVEMFTAAWRKIEPIVNVIGKALSWTPLGMAWRGGKALGAAAVAPGPRASSARVMIDFSNMPRGARATADPRSTADVDLSMGYSMVGP